MTRGNGSSRARAATAARAQRAAEIFDVVGIGFGPSNIALAVAFAETRFEGSFLFLERKAETGWQSEMMLPGSDIQHHPLRDLITPINPRSPYGFLSFLHAEQRLFEFLNLSTPYPFRSEYAAYVKWVGDQFADHVRHGFDVRAIERIDRPGAEPLYSITGSDGEKVITRALVLGPGRAANIPSLFEGRLGPRLFHLTDYLPRISLLTGESEARIAVIGASQSAVEILLDLHQRWPGAKIDSITRRYGYQTKDTSPFTHHVYFPEFVDDFYHARETEKRALWEELKRTNYHAADEDVVKALYARMYEDRVLRRERIALLNNREVASVSIEPIDDRITLGFQHRLTRETEERTYDCVVLATGFKNIGSGESAEAFPRLLAPLIEHFAKTEGGVVRVNRDYSLTSKPGNEVAPVYLNGLCEGSHGLGDAGSFSLVSLRADDIARSLANRLFDSDAPKDSIHTADGAADVDESDGYSGLLEDKAGLLEDKDVAPLGEGPPRGGPPVDATYDAAGDGYGFWVDELG